MITIVAGKNIIWSVEDTFDMPVSSEMGFEEGAKLRFDISQGEDIAPIISKTYSLSGDVFNVVLQEEERKSLKIGDYIYRIIILSTSGSVITEQSGDFTVKWGV